ncbi:phytosulfokines 2-like [Panicum miliaceum]|uniref:Phytosulfokine n=1 Tax=Panicum miliaceum TaxID=4540 RepID=A0A3L6TRF8_PANMI|nr:phytosulfokines 2-like [Panicum miliaceum]
MAASLCSQANKTTALNILSQGQTRERERASDMASSSKQQLQPPTLLLVAALLFLVCAARVQAARPVPGSKDHMPQVPIHSGLHVFSLLFTASQRDSPPLLVILQCFAACYFLQLAVSAAVVGDDKSGSAPGMEMPPAEPEAMKECEGEEEGEECLMRRTLVAHTDYIYTQGKHN